MVRCVPFEIRWHDTLPIYSCAIQPIAPARLATVLDYNLGQAAGLPPGQSLVGEGTAHDGAIQAPILAGGQSWHLATAGGDNNVRIWRIHPNIPSPAARAAAGNVPPHPPRAEYVATLARHTGVVNVVRFSPSGDVLASAGDDGVVLFWVRTDHNVQSFGESHMGTTPKTQFEKEVWRVRLRVRASAQELYDLAWSADEQYVAVGGTDFTVRIINATDGTVVREVAEHQLHVQGVAWDPLGAYLATQSSDRAMHMYHLSITARGILELRAASKTQRSDAQRRNSTDENKTRMPNVNQQSAVEVPALPVLRAPPSTTQSAGPNQLIPARLYGDERCSSFFRRLAFSPDGALLATPTGQFFTSSAGNDNARSMTGAVYLFARANFAQSNAPIAALPGHKTSTIAVSFSPILYRLREDANGQAPVSVFGLPYRMLYAVATQETVWIYDTQQAGPLYCFSNLHYASFTDLAWSPDGQTLLMASSDGYCSIAVFDYNELGRAYTYAEQPSLRRVEPVRVETRVSGELQSTCPTAPTAQPSAIGQCPAKDSAAAHSVKIGPSEDGMVKKKRRVALTFEGPLPS